MVDLRGEKRGKGPLLHTMLAGRGEREKKRGGIVLTG